jgi:hypothetical protein
MPATHTRLPLLAALVLLLGAGSVQAQRPEWTPIAELLVGSIGASDPARMSDVMSRCTALNMLFAGLAADFSADMSQGYEDQAHLMIEHGVLIESTMEKERTGLEADLGKLSGVIVERVQGMVEGYNLWLDENLVKDGLYINQDIELEMDSCKLASKLMNQMLAG